MSRVSNLKKDFNRILRRWKDALDEPKSEFSRDAAILRFELAYEVGWKLLQKLVRKEGYDAETPRQAFQRAFEIGWTQDLGRSATAARWRLETFHVLRRSGLMYICMAM